MIYRMTRHYDVDFNTIKTLITLHEGQVEKLKRMKKLYKDGSDITHRYIEKHKPNNKLVNNYASYITDTKNGYFLGIPVKIKSSNNEELLKVIKRINGYNDEPSHNMTIGKNMSIYGYAYELVYTDEDSMIRYKALNPEEIIYVVENNIEETPLFAIRYYKDIFLDEQDYVVEIYDKEKMTRYIYCNKKRTLEIENEADDIVYYDFGQVPITRYVNNEEETGCFYKVNSLIRAYDYAQSDTANDFEYFTDAFLVIKGMLQNQRMDENGNTIEDDTFKQKRIIRINEREGDVSWLTKQINDTASENFKNRLQKDIHKFSNTPDMSDENFGNTSGESLKWKISNLEYSTGIREAFFKKGLTRRNELICSILNLKYDIDTMLDIEYIFTRNIPKNYTELVNNLKNLETTYTLETRLEMLGEVDVKKELKRWEEENEKTSMSYKMAFDYGTEDTQKEDIKSKEEDSMNKEEDDVNELG